MRLFLFITLLALCSLCAATEKKIADTTRFELYLDDEKTAGAKCVSPVSEIRFSFREEKHNFGISAFTEKIYSPLPISFKFGNLGTGGALSLLNNPELSAGNSAFSATAAEPQNITATLPGWTSFSKPESAFLQAGYKNLFTANAYFSDAAASPLGSVKLSLPFVKNTCNISLSAAGGSFYYDDNSSSSWYLKSPYYSSGTQLCSIFQFGFYIKKTKKLAVPELQNTFSFGLYETPFPSPAAFYRNDFKLSTSRLQFTSSVFYNPYNYLLTSNDKMLSPSLQLKSGVVYKFPLSINFNTPFFVKAGLNAYSKFNLNQTEHPLKINAGIQVTTDLVTVSVSASVSEKLHGLIDTTEPLSDVKLKNELAGLTAQIKSSWNLKYVTPGVTLSSTYTPKKGREPEKKFKLAVTALTSSKKGAVKINGSGSFSFAEKNGRLCDKKLTATLTAKLTLSRLLCTIKISADIVE